MLPSCTKNKVSRKEKTDEKTSAELGRVFESVSRVIWNSTAGCISVPEAAMIFFIGFIDEEARIAISE